MNRASVFEGFHRDVVTVSPVGQGNHSRGRMTVTNYLEQEKDNSGNDGASKSTKQQSRLKSFADDGLLSH